MDELRQDVVEALTNGFGRDEAWIDLLEIYLERQPTPAEKEAAKSAAVKIRNDTMQRQIEDIDARLAELRQRLRGGDAGEVRRPDGTE